MVDGADQRGYRLVPAGRGHAEASSPSVYMSHTSPPARQRRYSIGRRLASSGGGSHDHIVSEPRLPRTPPAGRGSAAPPAGAVPCQRLPRPLGGARPRPAPRYAGLRDPRGGAPAPAPDPATIPANAPRVPPKRHSIR